MIDDGASVPSFPRRKAIAAAASMLGAEAAWRQAVAAATQAIEAAPRGSSSSFLPPGAIEKFQEGQVVVINNWLPPGEVAALRADADACFAAGHFKELALLDKKGNSASTSNRFLMNSFNRQSGADGPWANPEVGDFAVRQQFKARMATVKALLAKQLQDRPSLADDIKQTHEIGYSRFEPGAVLARHTDEKHIEMKFPGGAARPKKVNATRRSVTWIVYLNDDWDSNAQGGQLRVYPEAQAAVAPVGARGPDLQVAWLRARATEAEQPVFLDALRPGKENCMLYTVDASGNKRELSRKPFPSTPVLYLAGTLGTSFMVDDPADAERFHLINPRDSVLLKAGADGGERAFDIAPEAGTLVMFDSLSVPHEVLRLTGSLGRYAVQGWMHEKYYV
jgi:hypothetical protein